MELLKLAKDFLKRHPRLLQFASNGYTLAFGFNRRKIDRRGNRLQGGSFLKHCNITISGRNNTVILGDCCRLVKCNILIVGNNNRLLLGKGCNLKYAEFWMEDDGCCIKIGDGTSMAGFTHLAATEGKNIVIGNDCMFSGEVVVRTGDSHSIVEMNSHNRINYGRDVSIGNHVWIGSKVTLLKGSSIADNSVVATGSIINKKYDQCNIVLAGNPAHIVKENIDWLRARLKEPSEQNSQLIVSERV
jgi:acetyltransferase-like isoleucine patch superfamily enzyme